MRKTPARGIVYYNGNTYAPYSFAASTQVILQGMWIPGVTTSIGASNALHLVRIPRTHMVRAVEYGASADRQRTAPSAAARALADEYRAKADAVRAIPIWHTCHINGDACYACNNARYAKALRDDANTLLG